MNVINDIEKYVRYLQNDCGLFISLQPTMFETVINNYFMHYNIHKNPYCIYIKSNEKRWNECIKRHSDLLDECSGACVYMCHAGVWEVFYPVYNNDKKMCAIYVSGYSDDKEKTDTALESYSYRYNLDKSSVLENHKKYLIKGVPDKEYIDTLINPLIYMLSEAYRTQPENVDDNGLYTRVLFYLNEHHNENISLERLSEHFHYSKSSISHIFKRNNGKSISDYVSDLRITEAKSLLTLTNISITAISYALGFSDSNYFSNTFRKKCGVSPRKYRKDNKM